MYSALCTLIGSVLVTASNHSCYSSWKASSITSIFILVNLITFISCLILKRKRLLIDNDDERIWLEIIYNLFFLINLIYRIIDTNEIINRKPSCTNNRGSRYHIRFWLLMFIWSSRSMKSGTYISLDDIMLDRLALILYMTR